VKARFTLAAPSLADEAHQFEEHGRALAIAADRLLRKHGKRIVDEQLACRRLADAMIDLFAFAAVLARVSTRIEDHGEAAAATEREIVRAFAAQARTRIEGALAAIDAEGERALLALGDHVVEAGRYRWDNL
jgi:hypothetical protein